MTEVTRTEVRVIVYHVPCPVNARALLNALAQAEDEWWELRTDKCLTHCPDDWATVTQSADTHSIRIELNLDAR